ncbi:hypothetical protein GCM10010508_63430 [Streptomyces naganishii JCM 4654]|uniref:Uncharacterized protein n=1 Tax=Streptomyces naganishii JCM 4654 TaxID=1306179 RepID=A0A919CYC2_9ACTN|nr:hypothetical protein GCM10010508_63430 [Streptomyces naganishii JCM 4654]
MFVPYSTLMPKGTAQQAVTRSQMSGMLPCPWNATPTPTARTPAAVPTDIPRGTLFAWSEDRRPFCAHMAVCACSTERCPSAMAVVAKATAM